MKRFIRPSLVLLLLMVLAAGPVIPALAAARAARGAPGSAEFGFGAAIYLDGPNLKDALNAAGDLGLDWLNVPIAWSALQPDPAAAPQLGALDLVMQYADRRGISVMVSLSQAPAWAQTAQGPDPAKTAALVDMLARRYPALQAVELFPGANTTAGWGASPNPTAYVALFRAVQAPLRAAQSPVLLAAAGLQPQPASPAPGNMDDLIFLRELYQQGAADLFQVISIQYPTLAGSPLDPLDPAEARVFRHYENVRQVMVENHHASGRIWVTQICINSITINGTDSADQENLNEQSNWLTQGYAQLRAQLYVGVGFLQSLNLHTGEGAVPEISLVQSEDNLHPFYAVLREMVALNKAGSAVLKPGKAKSGFLEKQRQ